MKQQTRLQNATDSLSFSQIQMDTCTIAHSYLRHNFPRVLSQL